MKRCCKLLCKLLVIVWAGPWSLLGLVIGLITLATGGWVQHQSGVIEFYGGFSRWLLRRMPHGEFIVAMTLGHTIIGQSPASLDAARKHELIHVRQYERWGLFFIPAYFSASLYLWLMGRDAYRDNPFEREAYSEAPRISRRQV